MKAGASISIFVKTMVLNVDHRCTLLQSITFRDLKGRIVIFPNRREQE